MALTKKNWTLNSYTNDTWTDLVDEEAVIATVIINNTSATSALVSMRIDDTGSLAEILSIRQINAGESYTLDVRSLNITGTQSLQIQADQAGVQFVASGVV